MAERLTDKTALSTSPDVLDVIHVVDVSDTTSNAAGTSKKQQVAHFLSKGLTNIQGCWVLARASGATSVTALADGDIVMYASTSEFLIARLKGAVTTLPDDLRDDTKAYLFIDTTPLL